MESLGGVHSTTIENSAFVKRTLHTTYILQIYGSCDEYLSPRENKYLLNMMQAISHHNDLMWITWMCQLFRPNRLIHNHNIHLREHPYQLNLCLKWAPKTLIHNARFNVQLKDICVISPCSLIHSSLLLAFLSVCLERGMAMVFPHVRVGEVIHTVHYHTFTLMENYKICLKFYTVIGLVLVISAHSLDYLVYLNGRFWSDRSHILVELRLFQPLCSTSLSQTLTIMKLNDKLLKTKNKRTNWQSPTDEAVIQTQYRRLSDIAQ